MRHIIEERDELQELLRGRDLVVMQLNNEVTVLTDKVTTLTAERANEAAPAGEDDDGHAREELEELRRRFDDLAKEADALKAKLVAAKEGAAVDGVEKAWEQRERDRERETEWTLRSLETEIEAQSNWRQSMAETLQQRLDKKAKEADALRSENELLKSNAAVDGVEKAWEQRERERERETEWTLRSLETEFEAQSNWRQSVAETLQQRLDKKTKEADVLRMENATLKADASASAANQVDAVREKSASSLRSLEAELEAQAQWRERVAEAGLGAVPPVETHSTHRCSEK